MKRALMIAVMVCGMAGPAWAASVGLPAGTEDHRWEVTAEYTRLLGRDLKAPAQETDELSAGNQYHLRGAWAALPWLQPYVKLGASNVEERQLNTNIAGLGRRDVDLGYDWGFSWGGGLRGIYQFQAPEWFVGYDLQYLRSDNDLDTVRHSGRVGTSVGGEVSIREWHVAGYVGKTFTLTTHAN